MNEFTTWFSCDIQRDVINVQSGLKVSHCVVQSSSSIKDRKSFLIFMHVLCIARSCTSVQGPYGSNKAYVITVLLHVTLAVISGVLTGAV